MTFFALLPSTGNSHTGAQPLFLEHIRLISSDIEPNLLTYFLLYILIIFLFCCLFHYQILIWSHIAVLSTHSKVLSGFYPFIYVCVNFYNIYRYTTCRYMYISICVCACVNTKACLQENLVTFVLSQDGCCLFCLFLHQHHTKTTLN